MYLDTDVILALVKKEDWLKEHVDIKKLKFVKTSVLNIIEAQLILEREYSRDDALGILSEIKNFNIRILSIDNELLEKSLELREKYHNLNIFDSFHVACTIINKEVLVSTDNIFPNIEELESIDPRKINSSEDRKD